MKKHPVSRHVLVTLVATVVVVACWHDVAYAYIDPASGSYFLQLLLASLLGAAFAVKIFWRRIMSFFSRLFGKNKGIESPD
jgi:hypothetical protein